MHHRGEPPSVMRAPKAMRSAVLAVGFADELGCAVNGLRHLAAISATVVSSMRLEKPHSLSYQRGDLHQPPGDLGQRRVEDRRARVVVEVDRHQRRRVVVEDALQRSRSEAAFMIALTSSTVVSRAAMKDRSTIDTLIVGTRIA